MGSVPLTLIVIALTVIPPMVYAERVATPVKEHRTRGAAPAAAASFFPPFDSTYFLGGCFQSSVSTQIAGVTINTAGNLLLLGDSATNALYGVIAKSARFRDHNRELFIEALDISTE